MVQRQRAKQRLDALSSRSESGSTLIETVVCVAIATVFIAALGSYLLGRKSYALTASVQTLGALLSDARAVAHTSGAGASLVITSASGGGYVATLYPYRPFSGAPIGAEPVRTLSGDVAITPTAIFISSSGTASAAAWSPSNGTLATEPACSGAISLTFSDGFLSQTHTIPCGNAVLQ